MTDTEKAIAAFEAVQANAENPVLTVNALRFYAVAEPACKEALAALHEKQEREKGCEFCTGDVNTRANILDGDCGEVYIDMAGRLTAGDDDVKVRFCPMCGRPLTEKGQEQ